MGLWVRTYLLTGMPSTSVFTSIWELLGFQVSWPFAFSSIPNEGISMGVLSGILHLANRLVRMFFAPLGDDMDHVIIAWGNRTVSAVPDSGHLLGQQAARKRKPDFSGPFFLLSAQSALSAFICCGR